MPMEIQIQDATPFVPISTLIDRSFFEYAGDVWYISEPRRSSDRVHVKKLFGMGHVGDDLPTSTKVRPLRLVSAVFSR